jgi:hypothetical protein
LEIERRRLIAQWNGRSGGLRDNKGRARTRFHFVGENGLTYCRIKIPFEDDNAEVETRMSLKNQNRVCGKCLQVAGKGAPWLM